MLQSFSRPHAILAICCPLKKNACLLTTGNSNGAIGLTAYAVSNTTKAALRWLASLLEGVHIAVQAFAMLLKNIPNARFTIVASVRRKLG